MNNFVLGEITMSSMQEFFRRIKRRPLVFFGMLIITLILGVLETYNPIIKEYGSFSKILDYNYIKTMSLWTVKLNEFLGSGNVFSSVMITLLIMLVISTIISLFLSGYINIFVNAVDDKEKQKGEFFAGLEKNFFKTMLYLFVGLLMAIPFFFFILYSVVPTLFMIKQFLDGDTGVIFTMLLMALLTLVVVLFAIVFFAMYFTYVLPSIAGLKKRNARSGIKMTNMYAWYLLPKTALFLFISAIIRVLLFVIHFGHQSLALSIIVLLITAILRSFVYYFYLYFVFNTFIAMREDLYPDYDEEIPTPPKHIARAPQQRETEELAETEVEEDSESDNDEGYNDEYDDSFED